MAERRVRTTELREGDVFVGDGSMVTEVWNDDGRPWIATDDGISGYMTPGALVRIYTD